ncbi:MAG: hypothetical protein LAT58_03425 [Opitutales bacterium]|nr:hypothetical protein [Opitutales bacterium]
MQVEPIPLSWIKRVVSILKEGHPGKIEWTIKAETDWQIFGLEQEAYPFLIEHLTEPNVIGQKVVGMLDKKDHTPTDCWAFLCRHPWGSPNPIYAKIGLHHEKIRINLFSLHVDDGSKKLEKALKAYRKRHTL